MRAVVFTEDVHLYALVYGALREDGWQVGWKEGPGLVLADLEHLERGEVVLWRTPLGLRAYHPSRGAFLTRGDRPRSLAQGLRGRPGLRLRPGEQEVLLALGRGVFPRPSALGEVLGWDPARVRFFLRGLLNKFGLPLEALTRLARHQVQVAGLQGHAEPLPRPEVQPLLHVAGQEDLEFQRSPEYPAVGQTLGV